MSARREMPYVDGVLGIGIGTSTVRPRLIVLARRVDAAHEVLKRVGLRSHEAHVVVTNEVKPLSTCDGYRIARHRPIPVGVDIGAVDEAYNMVVYGCSIGALAIDERGNLGFVTNHHCTYYRLVCGGDKSGKYITQPGFRCVVTSDDIVGVVERFSKPYKEEVVDGTRYRYWVTDSAFVKLLRDDYASFNILDGVFRCEPKLLCSIDELSNMVDDPYPGERVVKFGAGISTTSTRFGQVLGFGTVRVESCTGDFVNVFDDVIVMPYMLSPGDSGSGLYSVDRDLTLVGINFAGSDTISASSRATLVEKELGVKLISGIPVGSKPVPTPTMNRLESFIAGSLTGSTIASIILRLLDILLI